MIEVLNNKGKSRENSKKKTQKNRKSSLQADMFVVKYVLVKIIHTQPDTLAGSAGLRLSEKRKLRRKKPMEVLQ